MNSFKDLANATRSSQRKWILLLSDVLALMVSGLLIFWIRQATGGYIDFVEQYPLLFFLLIAPCINHFNGLYDVPPPALPDELRNLAISTSLAWLCIAIFLFMSKGGGLSRLAFTGAWLTSLFFVPLLRYVVRSLFATKPWWGVPAVLFGQGEMLEKIGEYLATHAELGLRPIGRMFLPAGEYVANPEFDTKNLQEGLIFSCESELADFAEKHPEACAVVVCAEKDPWGREDIELATRLFGSVLLVPESFAEIPFWVRPVEIGQIFCLRVRQNLLDHRRLLLKRSMDIMFSLLGGAIALPIFALIAVCIRLESPGPIFFQQDRIGQNGKTIRIFKFRTMVKNAQEVLDTCLQNDPELQKEWAADQKLRNDPRITKVGEFLRSTSLDELPQLWNVIKGEMSLVGPRPIVQSEIERYGKAFATYIRVRPGITGLWQVSGRNDLSYSARIRIDRYYINNWSTWLDLLILAKTVPVVLYKKGAY